jgi:hypothetical protein
MTFYPLRQVEATRISPFTGQEIRYLDADADPEPSNTKYRPTRKAKECNESVWNVPNSRKTWEMKRGNSSEVFARVDIL